MCLEGVNMGGWWTALPIITQGEQRDPLCGKQDSFEKVSRECNWACPPGWTTLGIPKLKRLETHLFLSYLD